MKQYNKIFNIRFVLAKKSDKVDFEAIICERSEQEYF